MKIPQRHISRNYDYSVQSINFDTLSDNRIKISELPESQNIKDNDLLPLVDISGVETKKITFNKFKDSAFNVALSGSTNIDLIYNSNNTMSIVTKPTGSFDAIKFMDNTIQKTSFTQKTVYDIGSVDQTIAINYDYNKNIQLLSLDSSLITISKGSGWPNSNYVVESLLKITVPTSEGSDIVWQVVDEWYSQIPNPLTSGIHLVLLRGIGNIIEGHYIGAKTTNIVPMPSVTPTTTPTVTPSISSSSVVNSTPTPTTTPTVTPSV